MIELKDLIELKEANEAKIAEMQAENRVFDKLIQIEAAKNIDETTDNI